MTTLLANVGLLTGIINFELMIRDDYYENADRPEDEDAMETARFKSKVT